MMKVSLLLLLKIYQYTIRPLLGKNCRFSPSCSDYAAQAISYHGCCRGLQLAFLRLTKCHPWHPGGRDEIPLH